MNRCAAQLIVAVTLLSWGTAAGWAQEPKGADPAHTEEHGAATKAGESAESHPAADHGHGAAHDETDLSHGNASSQLHAAQELRFDLAIATFLVFLLLVAILTKFAWGPIVAGLARREETIASQMAEARQAAETARKQLAEYERKLAAATEEARAIMGQARQDAQTVKDNIVAEAQAAAQKERERAVADIASAKNDALREIAAKSVSTAVALAGNIIRREVKPEDHERLISESLQQFSNLN